MGSISVACGVDKVFALAIRVVTRSQDLEISDAVSSFTEVYLEEPLNTNDLQLVADAYLGGGPTGAAVELYLDLRKAALESLADGTGRRPHYSLRTLCRALRYAARDPCGSWAHSLYQVDGDFVPCQINIA